MEQQAGSLFMAINIDDLLRRAVESRASDLHLKVGNHPYLRVDGILSGLTDVPRITPEEMLSMAFSMMTNRQKQKFKETAELDMAYGVGSGPLPRQRLSAARQRRHGAARHPHQDSHHGRIEPSPRDLQNLRRTARVGAGYGNHGFR